MKIYITADIEGITGIAHWDETDKSKTDYQEFVKQMTNEVIAACQGAKKAGADEVWIKDAHETGRNIIAKDLPENIKLIRGWSSHPFCMIQEMDETFDALVMIGYHSYASSEANPLSHTLNPKLDQITINGELASEFLVHYYAAASVGVPTVFVSGDKGLCDHVNQTNKKIKTLAVNEGIGHSVISIHPNLALSKTEQLVEEALSQNLDSYQIDLPKNFIVELKYQDSWLAYKASFYPGMKKTSPRSVVYKTDQYFDVMRMLLFVT